MRGMHVYIMADTISPNGDRITTLHLRYPRYIHAQIMTYRLFARNVRSSRAVPTRVLVKEILRTPTWPTVWGKNKRGMQAGAELSQLRSAACDALWYAGGLGSIALAQALSSLGAHKQHANRPLEPYLFVDTLLTATHTSHDHDTWAHAIRQRCHPHAQPEIQTLFGGIREALHESIPTIGHLHLPYLTEDIAQLPQDPAAVEEYLARTIAICAARCARISFAPADSGNMDAERDLVLAQRLVSEGHLTPWEHVARACPGEQHGVLYGWESARTSLEKVQ